MLSLRLLIFSDIHNDWKTLERLLGVEADYYIAAGDQVTWAKGTRTLRRDPADRAATRSTCCRAITNRPTQVAGMCARHGLHNFHERHFQVGQWHVAGLGYSNPTPFNTPGEYSEPQTRRAPAALRRARSAGAGLPRAAVRHRARPDPPRPARRLAIRARVHREAAAGVLLLRPHPRGRGRSGSQIGAHARAECREGRVFVRIGLNPHDIRRIGTRISAPPRTGPGRAEVSLTPPRKNKS